MANANGNLISIDGEFIDVETQIAEYREDNWVQFDNQLKAFALDYIQHYNHRLSCKRADLPKDMGIKLIRDPLVSALISDLISQRQIRTNITDDMVSTLWLNMLPKLMGEEDIAMIDNTGNEFQGRKFHASESVRALTEISKSTKFYAEGSGTGQINIQAILINGDMNIQEASNAYRDMMNVN